MATVVKKKAVYVRGPNGIYRKKSYDAPSIISNDSELTRRKDEVDSALNDLMVCGFQVQENPLPTTKRANMKTKRASPTSSLDSTHTAEQPFRKPSSPRISFKGPFAENSPKLSTSIMERINLFSGGFTPLSAANFAIPYVLGVLTAVLIQQKWDALAQYAKMLTYLLFVGVFWAVLATAAFWYAGILTIPSWESVRDTLRNVFLRANMLSSPEKPVNYHLDHRDRRTDSIDTDTGSVLLSDADSEFEPKSKMRTESEPHLVREPSPQRLINVRPFVPPRRDSADSKLSQVPQPLLNRFHTDGVSTAKKSRFRLQLPERERPKDPRRHSSASLELTSKDLHKPLPALRKAPFVSGDSESLDLPLVHEVKLKSRFDEQLEALHKNGEGIGRLDTMLSKNSMLGTRANKRTFLSNVDEA
uniref:Uncharacterized protein n=1 Tax=Candidozyma auris TaxID=498019 RepID=A0A0L0P396_CANAR